jgi:hypothetical protein
MFPVQNKQTDNLRNKGFENSVESEILQESIQNLFSFQL